MTPDEIFAAMAEAYATCNSYRDTGTVVTRCVGLDAATNRTSTTRFKTAFARAAGFRFEFESEALKCGRFAVWSDGERAGTWNAAAGAPGNKKDVWGTSPHTPHKERLLSPEESKGFCKG